MSMMLLTMEIFRVAFLLFIFCCCSIFCFPSRPLNERSTELAWQAWLLVDDQNQNKHYDSDNLPRRRITPKSVFIAPTFSPESLPACAEGYRPDPMGRCIKIIKLDEEAHLDFLLEKLNAQFGNYDDDIEDDSQENLPIAGPFQLNIPLAGNGEGQTKDDSQENLDIAIVVAPTNGNFGLEDNTKTDTKRTNVNGNSEVESKPTPETTVLQESELINNNNLKRKTENEEQIATSTATNLDETTTVLPELDTTASTNILPVNNDETTTLPTTPVVVQFETETTTTITSELEDTTVSNQNALFFLKSSLTNTGHVQNGTNNAEDTPVVVSGNDNIISNDSLTTLSSNSTFVVNASINLNNKQHLPFASQQQEEENSGDFVSVAGSSSSMDGEADLMPSENIYRHGTGYVRFPSEETAMSQVDYVKLHSQVNQNQFLPPLERYASQFQQVPPREDANSLSGHYGGGGGGGVFDNYVHTRGADLKGNERFVFKSRNPVPETTFPGNLGSDPENGRHKTHINHQGTYIANNDRYEIPNNRVVFNHRNRDKHTSLWSIPSSWSESSPQKPIVLRFSRRSGNSRQLLEEHLRPHTQNSQTFYREVPSQDFSYIFGIDEDTNHDRKRTNR